MAVTAKSQEFGDFTYGKNYVLYRQFINYQYPEDSKTIEVNEFMFTHGHERHGKTNNAKRLLTPAGPSWRDPSSYSRSIVDVQVDVGTYEYTARYPWGELIYTEIGQAVNWQDAHLFSWDFESGWYAISGGIPWPAELESELITKCIDKLKGKRAQLGEDLAESVKTYESLTTETWNLINALRAVKHGNIPQALRYIGDQRGIVRRGADLFLQFKYGWLPLCSDIYTLAELLKDQSKPALLMTAHAGVQDRKLRLLPKAGFDRQGSVTLKGRIGLTGKINSSQSSLPDKIGLSNPLSLAWELIPWSLVVDWALPLGSILDAMTAPQGLDFIGGSTTFTHSGEFSSRIIYPSDYVVSQPTQNKWRVFSLQRSAYDSWPKPGLWVKSPWTPGHGESAIAFALQALTR